MDTQLIEFKMPLIGEGITEVEVLSWLIQEGEQVEEDDAVMEVGTDKVTAEVPAPLTGLLTKHVAQAGEMIAIDGLLGYIQSSDTNGETAQPPQDEETPEVPFVPTQTSIPEEEEKLGTDRFYSPLVRQIAAQENISPQELSKVRGTGINNRITKDDILSYVKERDNPAPKPIAATGIPSISLPAADGDDENVVKMDRVRQIIAENMLKSVRTSPHVSSIMEVDMSRCADWLAKNKSVVMQQNGVKVTYTSLIVYALAQTLTAYRQINVSIQDDNYIVRKKHINIGIATSLQDGNLIVPVIKDANNLSVIGIATQLQDLAQRARLDKLSLQETQGATYTFTNVGIFGTEIALPIIQQPQVAIMAGGVIKKKPVVIETQQGDYVGIRPMMYLCHTYDHRIIDGDLGGNYLKDVVRFLENFQEG